MKDAEWDIKGHLERAVCALWMHENNPPHPILDAILAEAYEALKRAAHT